MILASLQRLDPRSGKPTHAIARVRSLSESHALTGVKASHRLTTRSKLLSGSSRSSVRGAVSMIATFKRFSARIVGSSRVRCVNGGATIRSGG